MKEDDNMLDVPKYFCKSGNIPGDRRSNWNLPVFIVLLQICLCLQLYVRVYSSFLNEQTNHLITK